MQGQPATLTVVRAGLGTLVVDGGRPRSRGLGVPVGGAADRAAWAVGNALLGNDADAAALEVRLAGPTLSADADVACVLVGAPFEAFRDELPLPPGRTFTLHAGQTLRVGGAGVGVTAYLCVAGGLLGPVILGSRSSLAPLRAGDTLPCRSATTPVRYLDPSAEAAAFARPAAEQDGAVVLRVLPGAHADLFPPGACAGGDFHVTPESNRMGVRLRGEPLPVPQVQLVSEPVCPGTVQVTRDGQRILLGVDCQTIGGYPRLAHVIAADLDRLAQLRPGQRVRFAPIHLEAAEDAARERQERLGRCLRRLRLAGPTADEATAAGPVSPRC